MSDEYANARPPNSLAALRWTVAALAVLAMAPASNAANSPIGPSSRQGELTQAQILEHLYGGSFARSGDDFFNGSFDVKRIDNGAAAEQIFKGEMVTVRAVAAFSRNTEAAIGTVRGGEFEPLMTTTGSGLDVGGSADVSGRELRNAILALKSGGNVIDSTGANGADPMIAYSVNRLDVSDRTFVLFWEDAKVPYADFDYNDLVVEVAAAGAAGSRGNANVLIPLPAAAWSGLSVLGGVSLMAGIRKLRKGLRSSGSL